MFREGSWFFFDGRNMITERNLKWLSQISSYALWSGTNQNDKSFLYNFLHHWLRDSINLFQIVFNDQSKAFQAIPSIRISLFEPSPKESKNQKRMKNKEKPFKTEMETLASSKLVLKWWCFAYQVQVFCIKFIFFFLECNFLHFLPVSRMQKRKVFRSGEIFHTNPKRWTVSVLNFFFIFFFLYKW